MTDKIITLNETKEYKMNKAKEWLNKNWWVLALGGCLLLALLATSTKAAKQETPKEKAKAE